MKRWFVRFRKWLIVKLGGYIEPPLPVVRYERVDVPIFKLCFMGTYREGCSHEYIKQYVADGLAKQICDAGVVKYEYRSDRMISPDHRIVKGTIRVLGIEEE